MIAPAKIQVRFADCDMMGHVNNAIYLSYFEMARIYYFGVLFGSNRDWKRQGVILRTNEVEYLKPVLLGDEPEIYIFTEGVGVKSFTMTYELKVNGELRTTGKSVLVFYDSTVQKSIEIPQEFKDKILTIKK